MITGNLARTPFAHLILYIREHGLSGTLAMWPAGTSDDPVVLGDTRDLRSEEHTSELQSQWSISYAVFCLKKQISPQPRSAASSFFNDTATTEIYTLSLHDALPIY